MRCVVSRLRIALKSFKFLVKNNVLGSGGCRFALRVLGGFWRVLGGFWESWVGSGAGSGGFWVGSGWVLELKNTTLKSLKFLVKNSVLGSEGCNWERKLTLQMHCFGVLKSYEFIVKSRVLGSMSVI